MGLKLAQQDGKALLWQIIAIVFMAISRYLIYAVWTGIGAAGAFAVGVIFFGDTASFGRYLGAVLIILSVITLKISH